VGIYLPLELSVPILIGGIVAHLANKRTSRREGTEGGHDGLLFASGLITGEALIGIFMAIPIVISSNPDVIALSVHLPDLLGLVVIGVITWLLYRVAARA